MPPSSETGQLRNDWSKYALLVMSELERLDACEKSSHALYKEHELIHEKLNKRLERLDRIAWLASGAFLMFVPVYIWAIIELIKYLLSLA